MVVWRRPRPHLGDDPLLDVDERRVDAGQDVLLGGQAAHEGAHRGDVVAQRTAQLPVHLRRQARIIATSAQARGQSIHLNTYFSPALPIWRPRVFLSVWLPACLPLAPTYLVVEEGVEDGDEQLERRLLPEEHAQPHDVPQQRTPAQAVVLAPRRRRVEVRGRARRRRWAARVLRDDLHPPVDGTSMQGAAAMSAPEPSHQPWPSACLRHYSRLHGAVQLPELLIVGLGALHQTPPARLLLLLTTRSRSRRTARTLLLQQEPSTEPGMAGSFVRRLALEKGAGT